MSLDDLPQDEVPAESSHQQVQKKRKRELQHDQDEIEIDVSAPEPPSKKALRKLKKKGTIASVGDKPQPPNADLQKQDEKKSTLDTSNTPVKKSEHGIWIGNLPWSATKDDLSRFLSSNTTINEEDITRIHMPTPKDATKHEVSSGSSNRRSKFQNKGFAYIDFSTELAKTQAIALSEKLLTGRAVLIKDALSFEGRPKPSDQDPDMKSRSGKPPARRVFVGNLSFDITKEDVEQHFAKCGEVEEVFLATFEDSGKCKGYGWVLFESIDAASAAVRGWTIMEAASDEDDERGSEAQTDREDLRKKRKPRKWWVNGMRGRQLRIEFAEDPTTRYNKRFGKEAKATKEAVGKPGLRDESKAEQPSSMNGVARGPDAKPSGGRDAGESRGFKAHKKMKVYNGADSRMLEKMRGNIVAAEGKKITFD